MVGAGLGTGAAGVSADCGLCEATTPPQLLRLRSSAETLVVVGAGEPSPRALTASESELVLRRLLRIVAEVAQECKRREASSSAAEAQSEADHKTVSLSTLVKQVGWC